ncbi:hypothetical protein [Halomonas sp. CKK8]|uniref:hypothetical protein n=1 Tax=Halomonas sp. CKK8 TaxID=3036127 RepID=UPI00241582DD|nr:hypothetical protein [Halomonas sp. CKK8]WFM70986.1 hypothetical protein P8934_16560 [Halomonas sp. CKK8]
MNILDATRDPHLFARWFERGDWSAWFAFLAALFALPLDDDQRRIFEACTGRSQPTREPCKEAWLVVGRRGGKSFVTALVAVFLAAFHDYRPYLQPGERGTVLILAADRKQARTILRYVRGLLENVPMLAALVERDTADGIDLKTRVSIEIHTASFRATRGYTVVAALCDEVAFWRSEETANPDVEIINALRPGMATIPNAMLLGLSSPYSRRGVLYDAHRRYFGQDDAPVLVWQADTRTMNPTVPEHVIAEAFERDAAAASAEYGAEFRRDLEAFVSREALEQCTAPGVLELPPVAMLPEGRAPAYVAFVDPSGGSRDSMTLAIAHEENGIAVLDCVREWKPPFNPDDVAREAAAVVKSYGLASVTGDAYGGEWPRERFSAHGIGYQLASKPRSRLYLELLPRLNAGTCQLLDHSRLLAQLGALERRTSRAGRDTVDHPPRTHDDVANAAAGALIAVRSRIPIGEIILVESIMAREFWDGYI